METSNFHVVSLLLTWFKLNFHHSMEAFYYVRMYLLAMTAATALSLSRYAPPPPPRLHVRSEQESQIPKIAIYIHSLLSPASTLGVCLSVCWRMSRTRQLRGYSQRRWRISMDTKIATSSWGRRLAWQLTEQEGLPSATSSPRKPQQTQDSRAGSLWRLGDLGDTQRCTRSSLRGQKGCSTLPYTTIGGDWMGKMGRNMGWGIGSTESESEGGSGWGLDSLELWRDRRRQRAGFVGSGGFELNLWRLEDVGVEHWPVSLGHRPLDGGGWTGRKECWLKMVLLISCTDLSLFVLCNIVIR